MHRLTNAAEADLDSIWLYVATQSGSISIADRLIDRITDTLILLSTRPYLGRPRDADLRPGLRTFPTGEFVIIYRVEADDAIVLRIVHGSRDLPSILPGAP
jgi:toxin ParE1/3/4